VASFADYRGFCRKGNAHDFMIHEFWVTRWKFETYSLWNVIAGDLLGKVIVTQLVKKFTIFYGTWNFLTVSKGDCHGSLTWTRCVHSTST
jgi:hypothetical protein